MYDLENFGLRQMIEISRSLRHSGEGSDSMESTAREITDALYESFRVGGIGEPSCALVRCFKTQRYSDLPPNLREIAARALSGGHPDESMPCLTLLATRGRQPAWNVRHQSVNHLAIPLATAEMVHQAPMIARLVQQMGLDATHLLGSSAENLAADEKRTLEVFHVEDALGSAFVPSQEDFVRPYGIRSVLGFGGLLPTGELFFVVMFSVVRIRKETADLFRTLALGVKLAFLRHIGSRIFSM